MEERSKNPDTYIEPQYRKGGKRKANKKSKRKSNKKRKTNKKK
jgi:hypothetical protein